MAVLGLLTVCNLVGIYTNRTVRKLFIELIDDQEYEIEQMESEGEMWYYIRITGSNKCVKAGKVEYQEVV
jgi:uncharacterized protein (DUF305 family)